MLQLYYNYITIMLHHFITNIPKIAKIFWQKLPVPRAAALDLWKPGKQLQIVEKAKIVVIKRPRGPTKAEIKSRNCLEKAFYNIRVYK